MKCWTKKLQDWNGVDALIWFIEIAVAIYGAMGILIFWSGIVNWFKKQLKKIRGFVRPPHKTEFEEDPEF